ncbi:MAG: SdpI family protein [Candidatus Nanohaloarchaea archaeon]
MDRYEYASAGIFSVMTLATVYGLTKITGRVAVHFTSGSPDSYMGVVPGLTLIPGLAVLIYLLFRYLPEIDPLGDNYEDFREVYELLKVLILSVLAYAQVMIVLWNIGFRYGISYMLVPIIFSTYYVTGELIQRSERNWFIGIRNPWTLSSDEVWDRVHGKFGPVLKAAGLLSLLGFLFPEKGALIYGGPAVLVAVGSTIYSYLLYREESQDG